MNPWQIIGLAVLILLASAVPLGAVFLMLFSDLGGNEPTRRDDE